MPKQMEYFREYKNRLELAIGKQRAQTLINKAGVVISAGTNDFIVNYFGTPIRRQSYTVSSYQLFLLQTLQHFIKVCLSHHPPSNKVLQYFLFN